MSAFGSWRTLTKEPRRFVYLIVKRAGHAFELDGWVENFELFKRHPSVKPLADLGHGYRAEG